MLRFGRLLRAAGLDVPPGRMLDVVTALDHVDIARAPTSFSRCGRCSCSGLRTSRSFDTAFDLFWRAGGRERSGVKVRSFGERSRAADQAISTPGAAGRAVEPRNLARCDAGHRAALPKAVCRLQRARRVRTKDFAQFTAEEMERAQHADERADDGSRARARPAAGPPGAAAHPTSGASSAAIMNRGGEIVELPRRAARRSRGRWS